MSISANMLTNPCGPHVSPKAARRMEVYGRIKRQFDQNAHDGKQSISTSQLITLQKDQTLGEKSLQQAAQAARVPERIKSIERSHLNLERHTTKSFLDTSFLRAAFWRQKTFGRQVEQDFAVKIGKQIFEATTKGSI